MEFKYWEDVSEGEKLPLLRFPITIKTLILSVCGTREWLPYHHNSPYTKSIGRRDIFVSAMFDQALFGRFVTDWSGPESDFRKTSLQIVDQLCPGDVAVIEGAVTGKYREGDDYRAEIDMTASNHLGLIARCSATIAMPSREGGEVKPSYPLLKPLQEPSPDIPDFARPFLGRVSAPSWGAYPVSEAQIMYWCDMAEDSNPLYVDGEYARNSRHRGVIAPPMSLITWTMGRPGRSGIGGQPDVDCPERAPWPPLADNENSAERPRFKPPGTTHATGSRYVQEYGIPLRPGDRCYLTHEVMDCSPLKRTRVGWGHFVTTLTTYYNARDEIVGTNVSTIFQYGISDNIAQEQLAQQPQRS